MRAPKGDVEKRFTSVRRYPSMNIGLCFSGVFFHGYFCGINKNRYSVILEAEGCLASRPPPLRPTTLSDAWSEAAYIFVNLLLRALPPFSYVLRIFSCSKCCCLLARGGLANVYASGPLDTSSSSGPVPQGHLRHEPLSSHASIFVLLPLFS